jgi:hypothetical protein
MESCRSCGAALAPDAQWCGQCYAVVGAQPVGAQPVGAADHFGGNSVMSATRTTAAAAPPAAMAKTRWKKTATTFGPLGRVACTVALVVPFIVFVLLAIFTGGLVLAAPVIWGFVIMPWGLRDTWRAGHVPAS